MLGRIVALVADRVRHAIAVAPAEPLLERDVEPSIAALSRMVAILDGTEVRIRARPVTVDRLIQVSQQRDVAAERSDDIGRRDEARRDLPLETGGKLVEHRALAVALRR